LMLFCIVFFSYIDTHRILRTKFKHPSLRNTNEFILQAYFITFI
jgi:hypothetical protein